MIPLNLAKVGAKLRQRAIPTASSSAFSIRHCRKYRLIRLQGGAANYSNVLDHNSNK